VNIRTTFLPLFEAAAQSFKVTLIAAPVHSDAEIAHGISMIVAPAWPIPIGKLRRHRGASVYGFRHPHGEVEHCIGVVRREPLCASIRWRSMMTTGAI
jgi:hypothetical protein